MDTIAVIIGPVVIAAVLIYVVQHQLRAFQERMQGQMRGDLDAVRKEVQDQLGGVTQSLLQMQGQVSRQVQEGSTALSNTLATQLDAVSKTMVQMQGQVGKQMQDGATAVTQTLGGLDEKLGALGQATDRIREVGRDIASLQDILQAPKIRGGLGELTLENLLAQVLPTGRDYYATQHSFSDGSRVDAVIRLGKNLVPVDAKFPLENFRAMMSAEDESTRAGLRRAFLRDVRKHIDDIAGKYIRPAEGTYDFAFMYIPAENVYYEVVTKTADAAGPDLQALALERHVLPVSPNTFYAYLEVVVFGLRGLRIPEQAQEIVRRLSALRSDFDRFTTEWQTLGGHIRRAGSKYDEADKRLGKLGDRLAGAAADALPSEAEQPAPLAAPEAPPDEPEA